MALITKNNIKSIINDKETMIVWPFGGAYTAIKSIGCFKMQAISSDVDVFLCRCCDLKELIRRVESKPFASLSEMSFYLSKNTIKDTEDLIKEFVISEKSKLDSCFTYMDLSEIIEKYC